MHTAGITSFGTASGYVRYAGAPSLHCYDVASRFHPKILRVRGRHYAAVLARCNSITLCSSINNYVSSLKSTHYPSTTTQCPNKLIPPRKNNPTDDIKRQSTLPLLTITTRRSSAFLFPLGSGASVPISS